MPDALLDTNAVGDVMCQHPPMTARIVAYSGALLTSVVVCGEIRYGLERMPIGKRRNDLETRARTVLTSLTRLPVTEAVAERYGYLKADLQGRGITVQDNDLFIAATALEKGAILVSRDHIFALIPGLTVEDWSV